MLHLQVYKKQKINLDFYNSAVNSLVGIGLSPFLQEQNV